MQNRNPKSDIPAIKEQAAKDKDKELRQKSIDKERKGEAARYEPIVDNKAVDGRAQNRPVALEVSLHTISEFRPAGVSAAGKTFFAQQCRRLLLIR